MKKILLVITASLISIVCAKADGYGEFSLPNTTSADVMQKYIGQRIAMLKDGREYGSDDYRFRGAGFKLDQPYTIREVKESRKYLTLTLDDGRGYLEKIKIYKPGNYDSNALESCASFILIDQYNKFEADFISKHTNKPLYNLNNEEVAFIKSVTFPDEFPKYSDNLKTPTFIIESKLDGSTFEHYGISCDKEAQFFGTYLTNDNGENVARVVGMHYDSYSAESTYYNIINLIDGKLFTANIMTARSVCKKVGKILEHPRIITKYQITGIQAKEANEDDDCKYNIKNLETGIIKEYYIKEDMTASVFASDLSGKYVSILSKVEKPANSSIRYGKTSTISEGNNITRFSYIDNVIDIIIFGGSDEFSFILKNISSNSIKVVWNEAVFVGTDGSTSKVMHVGTKYSQREGDQPASTIIKGAKLEDIAVPTCNVRYSSILSEWVTDSMYPSAADLKDQQVRLMLPIQIKETINEYIFVFDLKYIYNHPEKLKY